MNRVSTDRKKLSKSFKKIKEHNKHSKCQFNVIYQVMCYISLFNSVIKFYFKQKI